MALFTAVAVPATIGQQLSQLQSGVHGTRWHEQGKLHITLTYFGDVAGAQAVQLAERLGAITQPQFTANITGVGTIDHPSGVAVWIAPNSTLSALAFDGAAAGRELGINVPDRAYRPHITLGYARNTNPAEVDALQQKRAGLTIDPLPVTEFGLYESTPGQGYKLLRTYPLGG